MISFSEWLEAAAVLPPVHSTGFWTDKFGEGGIVKASIEDLYDHAKDHPKGTLGGIKSLQLLSSYGSFPKSKMDALWKKYDAEVTKKEEK